jgi:hypothetical protein
VRPRIRLVAALVLSFCVYLIPFAGPHAIWLLGESLGHLFRHGGRSVAWVALYVGVAIALQAFAAAAWYWILGRPRSLRPLVLVVLVPAFVVAANWLYLVVIPTYLMIERETEPERTGWPIACAVPGESLGVVGLKPAVVRPAGDPTLVQNSTGRFARLVVTPAPDGRTTCEVVALAVPPPTAHVSPAWIGDAGQILRQRSDQKTGALSWDWIPGPGATAVALAEPRGRRSGDGGPIVARDGSAVAWLTPVPDSGQPPQMAVVVVPVATATPSAKPAQETVIGLERLERASFVPVELDAGAREILLAINERTFAVVGFDGAVRWGPLRPEGVSPLSMTFRRVGPGWVAWDGYKDDDGYVIAWSLPAGQGRYRVPRGRGVTDVAVQPEGRLIAFSTTMSLSIGNARDAVVVLRAADGTEVFRRFLPRYARSTVVFPARDLFGYTEWDGARAETRVLRVPPEVLR